ncbi:FMN-binding negative transcriptional regulator [Acidipila sp. EB88]|uniref:FMN-binding negative transcriptional regulator n=1 Tax=Acidipila sp. EB88 TaxID=2305226 RepID=UPI000F5F15C8|nr:FMN-binding negative transcriptional regulator [Acidipila sp. EB88]RRA49125.1 FMN-binding negative transcriptional regulator [Acidipila sp. EB88]
MHTPHCNAENDIPTLREFMRAFPLCALVTETQQGMVASHIPVVLHEDAAGLGVLRGHVARANAQWKDHLPQSEALAIFTGPQHYISASWYPDKQTHGKEVPTWNYVAVHAYGVLRVIEEPAWLLEHLRALTDQNEVVARVPWKLADAPPEFIANLSRGIVGLELAITRIEGKWKASQNRNDRDAAAVIGGLESLETPAASTMSALIRARRPRPL